MRYVIVKSNKKGLPYEIWDTTKENRQVCETSNKYVYYYFDDIQMAREIIDQSDDALELIVKLFEMRLKEIVEVINE